MYNPCPNVTRKHIHLTAFNDKKVNLAAHVIGDNVANSIEELYGPDTEETVKFLRMFKFSDCLSFRSMWKGRNKRNPNFSLYNSVDDQRLTFLTEEVILYLDDWQPSVNKRPGNFTKKERGSMMLSYQTITGIKISAFAISECVNRDRELSMD